MATRRPDSDSLAAIRAHWDAWHDGPIADGEIAVPRKGRAPDVTKVIVTPETVESPAWFTCTACPTGAQRFRADVGVDPILPPERHLTAIRRHFRDAHGLRRLPRRDISCGPDARGLAAYEPSTALHGAQLICAMCPEGNRNIRIDDPPYGDARSFSWLTMLYPELAREIVDLDLGERANRLEAHHRAILVPRAAEWVNARAHRRAQTAVHVPMPHDVTEALCTLLATAVCMGTPITRAIPALVGLMDADPIVHACSVAGAIPGLEPQRTQPPGHVAAVTRGLYGRIERCEDDLWTLWCSSLVARPDLRANALSPQTDCIRCRVASEPCATRSPMWMASTQMWDDVAGLVVP